MRPPLRNPKLLVVVALVTLPLACGADHGSLGDHATDAGTGAGSGGTSTGTTEPACGLIQLADVAAGIGGFVLDGEDENRYSAGLSVSAAGDMNGDGLADVIVGARYDARAYVVFGKATTEAMQLGDVAQGIGGFALDREDAAPYTGSSVSGVGDLNGDGIPDVVVGAPAADANDVHDSGRTYVVFGKADTDPVSLADVAQGIGGFAVDGEAEGDTSGLFVGGPGDFNGDGLSDVAVGAPWGAVNDAWTGRGYVVFGKVDTDAVSLADVALGSGGFAVDGEASGDSAGSVSGAGDVNGDGIPDLVVGAAYADANGYASGRAYVVFGKADTDAVSLADVALGIGGFAMDGEVEKDHAGLGVSGAGDVNGDGLADVLLGARGADSHGPYTGRTYVVFGKADTERVQLADVVLGIGGFVLDGEATGDDSGLPVAGAGDVNGDGIPDILVASSGADPNGENSGRAYVVFGGDFSCGGG